MTIRQDSIGRSKFQGKIKKTSVMLSNMEKESVITNKTLEEAVALGKQVQRNMARIPESVFRQVSLVQNLLSSFPMDYFKRIAAEQGRMVTMLKQVDYSSLTRAIASIQSPFLKLSEEIAKTQKYFKEADNIIREANTILFNLGWWIYPEWAFPSLSKIINAHKEGKDNEIEKAIINYFDDKKLDEMFNNWKHNKRLTQRIQILEQAVWAHKQGKYILSICALLPQVEGITNENSGKQGRITHAECINILKEYLNKKFKMGSVSSLFPLAVLKFTENLFKERFEWGKPSKKGRHTILHGHNVVYDDHVFSLKLILLIDYIQNLI